MHFLRPAPLDATVTLHGRVGEASEAQISAEVWLEWDGKERARADGGVEAVASALTRSS